MAAGLSLDADKLDPFIERITEWVNERLTEGELLANIKVDCVAQKGDLVISTIRTLDAMHPIGRGNEHPCLLVRDAVIRHVKVMGKAGDHLDLTLETLDGLVSAVWWRGAAQVDELVAGVRIDVVGKPIIDTWREERARLVIQDVALA
jgi:single-stranded-DNA-specific exonuclease